MSGVLSGVPYITSSSTHQRHFLLFYLHPHVHQFYFHFLIGRILHSFAPLGSFLRAFSSAFHIRFLFAILITSFGELFGNVLCSSKQIIDCTLECTMIYANVCIIYSFGTAYMLATFSNYTRFPYFKVELLSFLPWI